MFFQQDANNNLPKDSFLLCAHTENHSEYSILDYYLFLQFFFNSFFLCILAVWISGTTKRIFNLHYMCSTVFTLADRNQTQSKKETICLNLKTCPCDLHFQNRINERERMYGLMEFIFIYAQFLSSILDSIIKKVINILYLLTAKNVPRIKTSIAYHIMLFHTFLLTA